MHTAAQVFATTWDNLNPDPAASKTQLLRALDIEEEE
jgi:hypothetical protein